MTTRKIKAGPKPPAELGAAGRVLWRRIFASYEIDEPQHRAIFAAACVQRDRADAARKIIATEGVCIKDRFGQAKPHPAIDLERRAALATLRLLRELNLDVEPPDSRPPSRY